MKRSEIVSIIQDMNEDAHKNLGYGLNDTDIAELILIVIEKAGMLPPPIRFREEETERAIYRNEWEEESPKDSEELLNE